MSCVFIPVTTRAGPSQEFSAPVHPIGRIRSGYIQSGCTSIEVRNLEALDKTPIIDIKPVLGGVDQR